MAGIDTPPHRPFRSLYFSSLLATCLAEEHEQDDPPIARDVIGDSVLITADVKAELSQLASQFARVRLGQPDSVFL